MPIYEYACDRCEEHFEELVRIDTPDEDVECPSCGEHDSHRQVSVVSSMSAGNAGDSASCGSGSGFG